ncbi:MAG: hypothetical protein ACP5JH_09775 [Bacteroidota bacterium]
MKPRRCVYVSITFKEKSTGRDIRHGFSIFSRFPRFKLLLGFLKALLQIRV